MSKAAPQRKGAFSPVAMLAVILVGVFAFAAFFTLSAFAPELSSGRDGHGHALSRSAIGFAGAVRLVGARGDDVSIGRTPGDAARLAGFVILTPENQLSPGELEDASGASTLIILPKWVVGPHPSRRGWVASAGTYPPESIATILSEIAPNLSVLQAASPHTPRLTDGGKLTFTAGRIEQFQTISGPALEPIIVDEEGRTVLAYLDRGESAPLYILSDPDCLNTHGVRDIATARAGLTLLDTARLPDEPIIFDVTLNGLGAARSALRLAFEPPFLGATLVMVIATALLAWRAAARFGPAMPPRRAIPLGKAALAANSAALIRLAGRERKMGAGYARVIAARIAEDLTGARKDEAEAVAWLDMIAATHRVTPSFSALAQEAANAANRSQMLEAARKLHAWKQEIKRATR
jgi:hypothetical protein